MRRAKVLKSRVIEKDKGDPRKRNRKKTQFELELALSRLQKRGEKITLKAVAIEAKVSPSLILNSYPDFAEHIRSVIGKGIRQQKNDKSELLIIEREKTRELRELVASQSKVITKLASLNESLRVENTLHKAIAEGKVLRGDFGQKKH
jgi:hypothetical protein